MMRIIVTFALSFISALCGGCFVHSFGCDVPMLAVIGYAAVIGFGAAFGALLGYLNDR